MVLYAYSRRYSAPVLPWPVEIMLEEIQPRDELTYVVIDEKTKFTESDYQRLLDRLRAKEPTPCPTKLPSLPTASTPLASA